MFNKKILKGSSYVVAGACLVNSFSGCALTFAEETENSREGLFVDAESATIFYEKGAFVDLKSGWLIRGSLKRLEYDDAIRVLNDLANKMLLSSGEYDSIANLMKINQERREFPSSYFRSNEKDFVSVDVRNGMYLNSKDGVFIDFKNGRAIYGNFVHLSRCTLEDLFYALCEDEIIHDSEAEKIKSLLNTKNEVGPSFSVVVSVLLFSALFITACFESIAFDLSLEALFNREASFFESYREKSPVCKALSFAKKGIVAATDKARKIDVSKVKIKAKETWGKLANKTKSVVYNFCIGDKKLAEALSKKDELEVENKILKRQLSEEKERKRPLVALDVRLLNVKLVENSDLVGQLLAQQEIMKKTNDILMEENDRLRKENGNLKNGNGEIGISNDVCLDINSL